MCLVFAIAALQVDYCHAACTVLVVDVFGLTTFSVMALNLTLAPAYIEAGVFIHAITHKM